MKNILIILFISIAISACKKEKSPHPSYLTIDDKSYTLTDIYWVEGGRSPFSSLKARDIPGFELQIDLGEFPKYSNIYINPFHAIIGELNASFCIVIDGNIYNSYYVLETNDTTHLIPSLYNGEQLMYKLEPTQFINYIFNDSDNSWSMGTDTILVSGEFYVPEGEYEDY